MQSLQNLLLAISHIYRNLAGKISMLEPVALFATRFCVAVAFFASGLTKLRDWESTLMLFEYEYQVPVLPFELAAYLGTGAEIVLPLLLIAGLASRFSAIGLFIVNIVAVISLEEIAPVAYAEHVLWGVLLTLVVIFNGGRFALDRLVEKQLFNAKVSNQP